MKQITFQCERKSCNYKIKIEIDSMMSKIKQFKWPKEFEPAKVNGKKYHLCPACTQQHHDLQKEVQNYYLSRFRLFIQGKNHHIRQP